MRAQFEKHSDGLFLVTFSPEDDNEALLLTLLSDDHLAVQQRADGSATALLRSVKHETKPDVKPEEKTK